MTTQTKMSFFEEIDKFLSDHALMLQRLRYVYNINILHTEYHIDDIDNMIKYIKVVQNKYTDKVNYKVAEIRLHKYYDIEVTKYEIDDLHQMKTDLLQIKKYMKHFGFHNTYYFLND